MIKYFDNIADYVNKNDFQQMLCALQLKHIFLSSNLFFLYHIELTLLNSLTISILPALEYAIHGRYGVSQYRDVKL